GSTYTVTGVNLRTLLLIAFRRGDVSLLSDQIVGQPDWSDKDRFDIQAKLEGGRPIQADELPLLMQSLLEDRFPLKAHWEKRELSTYTLVLTKDGPKIKRAEDQSTPPPPGSSGNDPQRTTPPPVAIRGGIPVRTQPLPRGATATMATVTAMSLNGSA